MKKLLFLILVGVVISSCYPCKRLAWKCPPQIIRERYDSISVKDSIIYKDKEVEVKIPGDTVWADKPIPGITEKINTRPLILENNYAVAKAWIENSKLKMLLEQKDQVIKFRVDSAIQIAKHWEYKYTNEKQKEVIIIKIVPKFYKITTFILFLVVFLVGGYIFLKIKIGLFK